MTTRDITIGQIATLINVGIAIVSNTLGVALVLILVYIMRNSNPAIDWSVVAGRLHSSLWPTLLRADSAASSSDPRVKFLSFLTFSGTILLTIAAVFTPLGLKDGPIAASDSATMNASYIRDSSPIGLATPSRDKYTYGRVCGVDGPIICPGNDVANTTTIAPSVINTFSSTPQGPFNMQFRRYYPSTAGYGYPTTISDFNMLQSLVLRNDTFAIEGLIVDMNNPGVGLWNHTLPSLKNGGIWSADVLWLEPVTSCVNTNITLDYEVIGPFNSDKPLFNLTDRGGLVNLTSVYPEYSWDGQHIDLYAHAYKGAVLANSHLLHELNITRNESHIGMSIPLNYSKSFLDPGKVQFSSEDYLINSSSASDADILCRGYAGGDTINISTVAVHCFTMVGPPARTDDGDPKMSEPNSSWTQTIHYCASIARARIQTVTFSFNGTSDLKDLQISRTNNDNAVLWASEKTDINITDVDPLWGRVADSYENDSTLWTLRSDHFYIPAGSSDFWGTPEAGIPQTVLGGSWSSIYTLDASVVDYSGTNNFALLDKWQTTIQADPVNGPSRIINSIWTDLVANNLIGSDTSPTISVARRYQTVAYDFKYAIPAFVLLALWLPTFLGAIFILAFGRVRLSYLRYLLNQTSVGRIVVGDSALVVMGHSGQVPTPGEEYSNTAEIPVLQTLPGRKERTRVPTAVWAKTTGQTPLGFALVEDAPGVSGSSTEADSVLSLDRETGTGDLSKNGGSIRRRLRKVLAEMVSDSPSVPGGQLEPTVTTPMLERETSRLSGRMIQGDQS